LTIRVQRTTLARKESPWHFVSRRETRLRFSKSCPLVTISGPPHFLRGKHGVIRHIRGSFKDPESLAFGKDGLPKVNLYAVEFDLPHVWDDRPPPKGVNKISADIFERWLEPR